MRKGKVETNTGIREVYFMFIDDYTIECIDANTGDKFFTHCKSLI